MIKKKEIKFPNGNRAQLERPAASSPADDILKKLGIKQPEALIMIVGGAAAAISVMIVNAYKRWLVYMSFRKHFMILHASTRHVTRQINDEGWYNFRPLG